MGRSWRIGRLFGVPVDIHWTFLLVPPLLFWLSYQPGYGLSTQAFVYYVVLTVVLFSFVLAHELGHALSARSRAVRVAYVVLFPLGGGAALRDTPRTVTDEVVIYAAGPLVNLLLAGGLTLLLLTQPLGLESLALYLDPTSNRVIPPDFWRRFLGIGVLLNLVLGVANLLPAYPLDGGRILRALLRRPLGDRRATVTVTVLGVISAAALILLSRRLGDPLMGVGAVFIGLLSAVEYRSGWQRRRLATYDSKELARLADRIERLYRTDTVGRARSVAAGNDWPVLPVFDRWNGLSGFLSREVLTEEPTSEDQTVEAFYEAEFATATGARSLLETTEDIVARDVYGAAIYGKNGRIVGYVFTEDVMVLLDNRLRRVRRRFTRSRVPGGRRR